MFSNECNILSGFHQDNSLPNKINNLENNLRSKEEKKKGVNSVVVKNGKSIYISNESDFCLENKDNLKYENNGTIEYINKEPTTDNLNLYISTKEKIKLQNKMMNIINNFLIPNELEIKERKKELDILQSIISSFKKNITIELFGSYEQNLQTKDSDIDLTIIDPKYFGCERYYINEYLVDLKNYILKLNFCKKNEIQFIEATIPIIKIEKKTENKIKVKFDISLNNRSGLEIASIIKEHVDKEPVIKYSMLYLKTLLKKNELNETYTGGMGSFLLFHLVFFYFQTIYEFNKNNKRNSEIGLFNFLIGFLYFFGIHFDNDIYGISILNGGYSFLISDYDFFQPNICVLDCIDESNDLGKKCYRYNNIRILFEKTYNIMIKGINLIDKNK